MKKIVNECYGCKDVGLPCLGSTCPNKNVAHYYCDKCGDETVLYEYDDEELCQHCLLEKFNVIEGSEY